jgi:hypothetical protein
MRRKALIIGALIAVMLTSIIPNADAQRRGYGRGYRGYGYGYRAPRVWIAPPPPVVVIGPRYGYYHRPYYARPRYRGGYSRGYGRPYGYGYRRW